MQIRDVSHSNDLIDMRVTIDHQNHLLRRTPENFLYLFRIVDGKGPGKRLVACDDDWPLKGCQLRLQPSHLLRTDV